ncbi:nuclear transport factor 2 family protein [Brevibacillus sp. SYSU BS000544]|uniref:nuclear transport factor 2 family protein n=1 Tax=Brevibacillus sp. SYSU BS000544 TaxID=3416443 RepID=UPI003CE5BDE6
MNENKLSPEAVVQDQLDAYNARDIEAFLRTYAEDVQILEHPSGKLIMTGHAELREVYSEIFNSNPEMHCKIVNRTVFGKFVLDLEHLTGRVNREPFQALAMYEVEGNVITRVWFLKEE